jgi:hypothetical protein
LGDGCLHSFNHSLTNLLASSPLNVGVALIGFAINQSPYNLENIYYIKPALEVFCKNAKISEIA